MRRLVAALGLALAAAVPVAAKLPVAAATIVKVYPHDPAAFTEGLFYRDGTLYESTGLEGQSTIRQVRLPLSVHVFQFMWKHVITFLHNITIFVLLACIFGIWPGVNGLLFFPAMMLLLLNGVWAALILGPISARFRDIPPIVASLTQICFFLTPVFWSPSALPDRALFLAFNPFYHFIQIARQPLLGETASALNWAVCTGITIVLGIVAVLFFSRFRSRIAYWA